MSTNQTGTDVVELYADPICPWTWNTSRWLAEVADTAGLDVRLHSLSLAELNKDGEVPEEYQARMAFSRHAARAIEHLVAEDRNDDAMALFVEIGTRVHHDDSGASDQLLADCAAAIGLTGTNALLAAAHDESGDKAVTAAVEQAMAVAGPDVGSPVLVWAANGRGFSGPVVSPPPIGDDAMALWQMVRQAFELPGFFELKRGRQDGPVFGPRP